MNYLYRSFKFIILAFILNFNTASSQTYTIGVENINYNPYYYADVNNKYYGFSGDLLKLFSQKSGIQFKYEALPVYRLYKEFTSGKLDFKFPDSPLWQQDMKANQKVIYSDNVISFIDGIVVKNENKDKDISFIKVIGTVRGFELNEYKKRNIIIEESSTIVELVDKLNSGKIDAVYFNIVVALHYINTNSSFANKFSFRKDLPYVLDYYKLSTIKHKSEMEKFNQFLKNNMKEIIELKKKNGIIY